MRLGNLANVVHVANSATVALVLAMSCHSRPDDLEAVKSWVRSEFPDVEQVSTEELKEELSSEPTRPVLLDVRTEEEYRVSHIAGAIRVEPGGAIPDSVEKLDRNAALVAYCSVGYRSSQLAERLQKEGFKNVKNLEGSIFEWANKGYPVERDGTVVREVHPFDEEWGQLLEPTLRAYRPGAHAP
jgi:rhodanese-related sulfurtransferase